MGRDHDRHAESPAPAGRTRSRRDPSQRSRHQRTVVDPQGKPVADSKVIVTIETGRRPGGQPGSELVREKRSTLTTDATGRYHDDARR